MFRSSIGSLRLSAVFLAAFFAAAPSVNAQLNINGLSLRHVPADYIPEPESLPESYELLVSYSVAGGYEGGGANRLWLGVQPTGPTGYRAVVSVAPPSSSCPAPSSTDSLALDFALSETAWATDPGGGTNHRAQPNDVENAPLAHRTARISFGDVCPDLVSENIEEFTIYAWFDHETRSGDRPNSVQSKKIRIVDDDGGRDQAPAILLGPPVANVCPGYTPGSYTAGSITEGGSSNSNPLDNFFNVRVRLPEDALNDTVVRVQIGGTGADNGTAGYLTDFEVGEAHRANSCGALVSNVWHATVPQRSRDVSRNFLIRTLDDSVVEGTETIDITGTWLHLEAVSVQINLLDDDGSDSPDNRAPTVQLALPDQTVPRSGGALTVDLAAHFTDPDPGDTLTYAAASSVLSVATVQVSDSTLTITAAGTGSTTITVTATDSGGLSASDNFVLTVAQNRNPSVSPIPDQTVSVSGGAVTLDLGAYFSDADGDDLTYAASSSKLSVATVQVADSTLTVTPLSAGTTRIGVTARDPAGATASESFDVTVTVTSNTTPAADDIPDQTVSLSGGAVTLDLGAYFSDADGDDLTYAASSSKLSVATVQVADSTLTVTPLSAGTTRIGVTARDPAGATASESFDVTVTEKPPENQRPVVQQVPAAVTLTYGSSATVDVSSTFVDPEGDALTYVARSDRPDIAAISPAGPTTGVRFTVSARAVGNAGITITATDSQPGRVPVPASFGVTVDDKPNSPPALVGAPPALVRVEVGATEVVSLVFTDPDGDVLGYTATSARPGIAGAAASRSSTGVDVSVTGVAIGETVVTVLADDGRVNTPATFNVEVVLPAVDAPGAPVDVVVTAAERSIDVRWRAGTPAGDRFRVRWREIIVLTDDTTSTAGDWVDAGPRTGTSFTLPNLKAATTYRIEVRSELAASPAGGDCASLCSEWVGAEATTGRGNRAPVVEGEIPAVAVAVYDSTSRDVSSFFSDPDGDPLAYSAVVTDVTVAQVAVSGSQVVVRGLRGGSTGVAVTARDPGGLTAVQRFAVEVEPPPPPVVGLGVPDRLFIFPPGRLPPVPCGAPAAVGVRARGAACRRFGLRALGRGRFAGERRRRRRPAGFRRGRCGAPRGRALLPPGRGRQHRGPPDVPRASRVGGRHRRGRMAVQGHPLQRARVQRGVLLARRQRHVARRARPVVAGHRPRRASAPSGGGRPGPRLPDPGDVPGVCLGSAATVGHRPAGPGPRRLAVHSGRGLKRRVRGQARPRGRPPARLRAVPRGAAVHRGGAGRSAAPTGRALDGAGRPRRRPRRAERRRLGRRGPGRAPRLHRLPPPPRDRRRRREAAVTRGGPLELDLGFFELPRWGAAVFVPAMLAFHLGMPYVWPLLPVRPAEVDRVPVVVAVSKEVAAELEACLAAAPPDGCRPAAAHSWTWAVSEFNLLTFSIQLGTAPLWSRRAAERRMRAAADAMCPPGMSRADMLECRRFEIVGLPGPGGS